MLLYTDYTDDRLLQLVGDHNEQAFTELFFRYDKRIYAFVVKMTKDEHIAQELTQQIFIKIWDKRTKFSQVENPLAYIFTLAANHTFTQLKRQLNEKKVLESLARMMHESMGNDTEDRMNLRDSENLITQAIEKLPPQQKRVYDLSRNEDLNYQEIGELMQISPNTVRNHLVEARRSIRQYLEKNGKATLPFIAIAICLLKK